MSRKMIERRLIENGTRLKSLREDLRVTEEQHRQLADEADDARLRALVSETPLADKESREAQRHAETLDKHMDRVREEIAELEQLQDQLLDEMSATRPESDQ